MSYTKHNFVSGSHLYASQLNEMDDQIADNEIRISALESGSSSGTTTQLVRTRNLYDKDTCLHEDGCSYSSYGNKQASNYNAHTGIIPCEANKTYTFKAGSANVSVVTYFSNGTFLSRVATGGTTSGYTFTTHENCNGVSFTLFAQQHTTEEYENAINTSQLEEGTVATSYVPYWQEQTVEGGSSSSSASVQITNEKGSSEELAVSQKLFTDEINELYCDYNGKNLYDKESCNPKDGYNCSSSGVIGANSAFAFTGKIPCEASKTYIFSCEGALIQTVCFFNESTYISRSTINGSSFTTPSNCTHVGFNLFATSHTTEEFNNAINSAQLEEGTAVTEYESYVSAEKYYSFVSNTKGTDSNKAISQRAFTNAINNANIASWWNGKKGTSLGDSITYKFNRFQKFVKSYLKLDEFYNHGRTGTRMSGVSNEWGDSMNQTSRINELEENVDFVTVLGGANDSALIEVGEATLSNHDINTYCGAFNVTISKIYYKYLALEEGYYADIDYSGIIKATNPHNVLIIPCTQFYFPGGLPKGKEKADAIKTLCGLWGLKVCDFYYESQSNPFVANYYWGESDNVHPTELFYRERIAPMLINALESMKPIEFGTVD